MHKVTISGKEVTVQEREDWKTSIDENFKPGDYFDEEIAWDLINAVPPHRFSRDYFQCGEPHSHELGQDGQYHATYLTLDRISSDPEVWLFCGYCFDGEYTETWHKNDYKSRGQNNGN